MAKIVFAAGQDNLTLTLHQKEHVLLETAWTPAPVSKPCSVVKPPLKQESQMLTKATGSGPLCLILLSCSGAENAKVHPVSPMDICCASSKRNSRRWLKIRHQIKSLKATHMAVTTFVKANSEGKTLPYGCWIQCERWLSVRCPPPSSPPGSATR